MHYLQNNQTYSHYILQHEIYLEIDDKQSGLFVDWGTKDNDMEIRYEIRVSGHLSPEWTAVFEGMEVTCLPNGDTALTGLLLDQATLYGLLLHLRDFGLTLVSVNPAEAPSYGCPANRIESPIRVQPASGAARSHWRVIGIVIGSILVGFIYNLPVI